MKFKEVLVNLAVWALMLSPCLIALERRAQSAQDPAAPKAAASPTATPTPPIPPPTRASYKLPEGPNSLAEQAAAHDTAVNAAETALLKHVGDGATYEPQDNPSRLAAFNRQEALFQRLRVAQLSYSEWIRNQRREFKCDSCVPVKDPATGKWRFEEQPAAQAVTNGGQK